MTERADVLAALGGVYYPELDEPITDLRFVASCEVSAAGDVEVRLRLRESREEIADLFAFLESEPAP